MFRLAAASLLIAASAGIAASAPLAQPQPFPADVELKQAEAEAAAAERQQSRFEQAARTETDEASRLHARQLAAAQAIAAAEARITAADAQGRLVEARLAVQRRRLVREQAPVSALLAGLAMMAWRPPVLLLAGSASAEDLVKLRLLVKATEPVIRAKTATLSLEIGRGDQLREAQLRSRNSMLQSRRELAAKRDSFASLEVQARSLAKQSGGEAIAAGDVTLARQDQLGDIQRQTEAGESSAKIASELEALGPARVGPAEAPDRPAIAYRLPSAARVVDGLGSVSASGVRARGITLATRRGSPLVAPADGTILFSGPFRDYDGIVIIDHGGGWKSVLVNAGSRLRRGDRTRIGEPVATALGPVEVQLLHDGSEVSPAIIAGSSEMLSNPRKSG